MEGVKMVRPTDRKYTVRFGLTPIAIRYGADRYMVGFEDGELKIFDQNKMRNPVFLFEQDGAGNNTIKSIWEPTVKNYFPHKFDWDQFGDITYQRLETNVKFRQMVEEFANANGMSLSNAVFVLQNLRGRVKSNKYANLEVERKYSYPGYRKDFFNVSSEWIASSFERLHEIEQLGQMGEVLNRDLEGGLNPTNPTAPVINPKFGHQETQAVRRALFQLRCAFGVPYTDLGIDNAELMETTITQKEINGQIVEVQGPTMLEQLPFWDEDQKPVQFQQNEPRFGQMTNTDWAVLLKRGVIIPVKGRDGWFQVVNKKDKSGRVNEQAKWLNNPYGADPDLMHNYVKARDIVLKHLGLDPNTGVEHQLHRLFSGFKGLVNFIFLQRAWTANITQPTNTALATGLKNTAKGVKAILTSPEGRSYARAIGATVEDFTQHIGGGHPLSDFMFEVATPFSTTEENNRIISALAGRNYATDALVKLSRSPITDEVSIYERRKFEEMNIAGSEVDEVLDQKYSEEELWQASKFHPLEAPERLKVASSLIAKTAKATADFTQFRTSPADLPKMYFDGPLGRLVTQFTTFTTKQTEFAYKMLVGRNKGDLLKNLVSGGGLTNIGSFLVMAFGLGFVANILHKLWDPEERDEAAKLSLKNAISALSKASILGIFTELIQGKDVPGSISTLYGLRILRIVEDVVQRPQRIATQALIPIPGAQDLARDYINTLGQQSPRPSAMAIIQQRTGQQRPEIQRPQMR